MFFRKIFVILRPNSIHAHIKGARPRQHDDTLYLLSAPFLHIRNIRNKVKQIKAFITILLLLLTVALPAAAGPFTLVIDAGHGGNDPGAIGQKAKEKNINLNVALALGKLIETNCKDVKVVYTRKSDVFVSLQGRADIANKAKADLFISIHTNSTAGGASAYGAETYTLGMHRAADNLAVARRENSVITMESDYKKKYQGFDPNKAESYIIFELMQDKYMAQSVKLAQAVQKQYASAGRKDKGVHQAGFLVLRETSMPSILTELGFISNPTEEAFLSSTEGVNKLARSIYDGFVSYRRQLADFDSTVPTDDAPLLASNTDVSSAHSAEGATQDVAEDVVPSIRPVKTIPYPTPGSEAKAEATEAPKTEAPKAEKPKEEKPKTEAPKVEKPKEEKPKAEAPKAEKPKEEKPKAEVPKAEKPKEEKPKTETPKPEQPAIAAGKPEFRLQLFTSSSERKTGDASFKGLPAEYYKEGDTFKYTYGKTASYEEIIELKKTVADKFPGVFIIALLDGKRIDLKQAIELSKQK